MVALGSHCKRRTSSSSRLFEEASSFLFPARVFFSLSIISELYCNKLRLKSHLLQVRAPEFGGEKKVDLRTLNSCSAATEASMSTGKNEVKSCPIPTRVLTLKDWSQLPDCYSQTPGGTLFSTTPGGNNNNNLCFDMSF